MSGSKHANTQYPPPTGPYKVTLRNRVSWQGAPEVRLQISVGKPGTEGEKLFALCEWAAVRFPRAVLVVSDTLQRHNLMLERAMSETDALAASRRLGDEWLDRHRNALALLGNVEVLRWDDALAHPETGEALEVVRNLYVGSPDFRAAIDRTVDRFWSRNHSQNDTYSALRRGWFEEHSRTFLLEELAVFSWLCKRPGVDAYAGSWMADVFKAITAENDSKLEAFVKDWVEIDYTRNKAFNRDLRPTLAA